MLTTLAILFVVFLLGAVVYGFGIVMRRPPTVEELQSEKCSICRDMHPKKSLVERPIGDYKVLWFCSACIEKLTQDLPRK